ncbi:MAG: DUF4249 domain-containing protein [Bacteroidales bacterium]|nr:DUF4249 domain-containing protein [Bacteroidales bacterium]
MKTSTCHICSLLLAIAAIVIGCESDSDIVLKPRTKVIVSALAYPDSSLVVYVYGSTAYTDTATYDSVGEVTVDARVNGTLCSSAHLSDGSVSANLGKMELGEGDRLSLSLSGIEGKEGKVAASSVMLKPVEILRLDTVTIVRDDRQLLEMYLLFDDPPASDDFYQIEARIIDGEKIVPLSCNYSDYLFYLASASISPLGDVSNNIGLFTDEFVSGKYNITFSVGWDEIRKAVAEKEYQGHRNAILEVILYRHTYEYYNFARTASIAQEYLVLPVFGIPAIYSNVENGEGIVSCMAFSSSRVAITL